jgi:primosomal protein N'
LHSQMKKDLADRLTEQRTARQTAIAANWGHLRQSAQAQGVSVAVNHRCEHPIGRLRTKRRDECHVCHKTYTSLYVCPDCASTLCFACQSSNFRV